MKEVAAIMDDFLTLLDDLEYALKNGRQIPIGNKVILDRQGLLSLLQKIRDAMPQAVSEADRILAEEKHILSDAQRSAENTRVEADAKASTLRRESEQRAMSITEKARQEAESLIASSHTQSEQILQAAERKQAELVSQTAVLTRAQEQAEEILANAQNEAQRLRAMTLDHCDELLKQTEEAAVKAANSLRSARIQLDQQM